MKVGVVVDCDIKEDQMEAYMECMYELMELTHRDDEGCIAYDIYRERDGSDIKIIEVWESQEAILKHCASEHYTRIVPEMGAFQNKPPAIRFFDAL